MMLMNAIRCPRRLARALLILAVLGLHAAATPSPAARAMAAADLPSVPAGPVYPITFPRSILEPRDGYTPPAPMPDPTVAAQDVPAASRFRVPFAGVAPGSYLRWNGQYAQGSAQQLAAAMSGAGTLCQGFAEAVEPRNYALEPGDWLAMDYGASGSVDMKAALDAHIATATILRLPAYGAIITGTTNRVQADQFIAVRLLSYNLGGGRTYLDFGLVGASAPDCDWPPQVATPASFAVEASGPAGAAVSYTATISDDNDLNPTLDCDPASGATFALGATLVACVGSDDASHVITRTFTITVQDTTAPALTVPDDITVRTPGANGAAVEFAAQAVDAVDAAPTVVCAPASGSQFALGATEVECTASDAAGNNRQASFTVTVAQSFPLYLPAILR